MTDLDAAEATIDARARAAASGLRNACERRTLPAQPVARRQAGPGPARGWRIAIVATCVTAAIAGLAVVARRDTDRVVRTPNGDPYWVVDGLHDGWTVERLALQPRDLLTGPDVTDAIFGSPAAPGGPIVAFVHTADGDGRGLINVANLVEIQAGGRHLVLGDNELLGTRTGQVVVDGQAIAVSAAGATDGYIAALAAAVVLGADRAPEVPVELLPAGTVLLARGPALAIAPAFHAALGWSSSGDAARGVRWTRPRPDGIADSVVLTSASSPLAVEVAALRLGDIGEVSTVDLGGTTAWMRRRPSGGPGEPAHTAIVWERSGITFALVVDGDPTVDSVALAGTVRPAQQSDALSPVAASGPTTVANAATTAPPSAETVVATTRDGSAPTTSPQKIDARTIVAASVTRTDDTPDEVRLDVAAPDGTSTPVAAAVVAGKIVVTNIDGNGGVNIDSVPDSTRPSTFVGAEGCIVVSIDPAARTLVGTDDTGTRYGVPLTSTTHHPEVKFAVLPARGVGWTCALLDGDGNVLAPGASS